MSLLAVTVYVLILLWVPYGKSYTHSFRISVPLLPTARPTE
jgi:hypothetical protein